MEDEGEGVGNKGDGKGIFLFQRDKGLLLAKGETAGAHKKMAVYQSTRGNPLLE